MLLLVAAATATPLYISPVVRNVDDPEKSAIIQVGLAQAQAVYGAGAVEPADSTREYAVACTAVRCDAVIELTVYHLMDRYYAHLLVQSPSGELLGDYDGVSKDLDNLGVLMGSLARSAKLGRPANDTVSRHKGEPGEIGHDLPPRAIAEAPEVPDRVIGFSLGLMEPFGDQGVAPTFVATWVLRSEQLHWYLEYDAGILINAEGWYGCGGGGAFGDVGAGWFIVPRGKTTPYLGARTGLRVESVNCALGVGLGAQLVGGVEFWRNSHQRFYVQGRGGGDFLTAYNNYGYVGLDVGVGF